MLVNIVQAACQSKMIISLSTIIIILVNMIFTDSVIIKFIKLVILMFTSLLIISCTQARPHIRTCTPGYCEAAFFPENFGIETNLFW